MQLWLGPTCDCLCAMAGTGWVLRRVSVVGTAYSRRWVLVVLPLGAGTAATRWGSRSVGEERKRRQFL